MTLGPSDDLTKAGSSNILPFFFLRLVSLPISLTLTSEGGYY